MSPVRPGAMLATVNVFFVLEIEEVALLFSLNMESMQCCKAQKKVNILLMIVLSSQC